MKIIEVIANPYIALDKDGVPQGVVSAGMPNAYIGAQLDLVGTQKTGKTRFFYPLGRDGKGVAKVAMTSDVATAIHAGELIVVRKADALACGLTDKEFLEPGEALAAEKDKALAYYRSARGPEASVAEIPREPTTLVDSEATPVQTASKQITPTVKLTKNTEA